MKIRKDVCFGFVLSVISLLQFQVNTAKAQTGEALNFDGSNDVVTISPTLGNFGTSDFTFETWFKTTGIGDMALIAKRPACSSGNFWNVRMITGRIWFEVQQNATTTISVASPVGTLYNDGAWHHLAVVRHQYVYTIFVNGVQVGQGAYASILNINNNADLNLGAGPCGSFNGTLDETRLWNIALNSYEILSRYQCEIVGASPGLLFNYHYNQGIANGTNTGVTTLIDDSENNNDGTLTNFALSGTTSNWVEPSAVDSGVACSPIASQIFQLNGNGGQDWTGDNCYTLTSDMTGLFGSIWHKQKVDLSQDFDMSANLNFGTNTNPGADGITFTFQNLCTSVGIGGQDIGIGGVSPSLVIEFDTYQNTDYSDPANDHLAIFKNGVLNHGGANQLVAPVQIDPTNAVVTTGIDYLVHILWSASSQTLSVLVNDNLRSTYTGDIVTQIFSGSPYVYWGFTAATGGYSNRHEVCILDLPTNIIGLASTDTICYGNGYQANVPGYATYSWSPTTGVSDPTIGNPVLSPETNTTYTLSVTDDCGNVQTQTIDIVVNQSQVEPTLACYETATFNDSTCQWDVTGTMPTQPTLACYESATFNTTTCEWDVTGSMPTQPNLACYESATFNNTTCQWDVTGSMPTQPTLACYESATFNTTTCEWDVTGTIPTQPTLACYETATFNNTTCQWDVTGSMPTQPTLACYESATFNTSTCEWDVTGTIPTQPTLACYETAMFNNTTCEWDVTGTMPTQPTLACYESATFNTSTCEWDVTGTIPTQPTLACYETATFNNTTCEWDVAGTPPSILLQPLNQTVLVNADVQFIVASSASNATFQWQSDLGFGFENLNNGGQYSGVTSETLTISNVTMSNNNQSFICIITSGSCSDTSNVAVLTINNDVSVEAVVEAPHFTVFPNPVSTVLRLNADFTLIGKMYTVYDCTGKAVLSDKIKSENTDMDVSHFSAGIYMISIGESKDHFFKFIKE